MVTATDKTFSASFLREGVMYPNMPQNFDGAIDLAPLQIERKHISSLQLFMHHQKRRAIGK